MTEPSPEGFYVYIHRRQSDGKAFYVGKGKDRRAFQCVGRNGWWHRIKNKHGLNVEIYRSGMSEVCAFSLEKVLIWALKANGADLCNISSGGLGASGVVSAARRRVFSSCGMEFSRSEDAEAYLRANGYPSADRSKISQACTGRRLSAYGRAWSYENKPKPPASLGPMAGHMRHRVTMRDRFSKAIYSSLGEAFENSRDATFYLRANGYPRASWGNIGGCARGEKMSAYGRAWSYEGTPAHPKHVGKMAMLDALSKKVSCSNGMKFNSAKSACEWLKCNGHPLAHGGAIAMVCKGKRRSAYGYGWEYWGLS